jgi:AraC-like DNA-binding protein
MRYEEHPAPAVLRRHVECLWTLSSGGGPAPPEAGCILPDGGVELVVSAADRVRRRAGERGLGRMLVGPLDQPVRVVYEGRVELVAARFRPAAARVLATGPLRRLRNAVVPLASVAPDLDARLVEAMRGADARAARLDALGRVLADALPRWRAVDAVVEEAARRIAAGGTRLALPRLARELGVSERTLERRFDDVVGLSPRRLARVLRFRSAWEAATEAESKAWSLLALDCGYADQPHLIRDFRRFAGTSPGRVRPPRARARAR